MDQLFNFVDRLNIKTVSWSPADTCRGKTSIADPLLAEFNDDTDNKS